MAIAKQCQHRALQLCKEQDEVYLAYVCGKCSARFQVQCAPEYKPVPKEPMFPKHNIPWGLRERQA